MFGSMILDQGNDKTHKLAMIVFGQQTGRSAEPEPLSQGARMVSMNNEGQSK